MSHQASKSSPSVGSSSQDAFHSAASVLPSGAVMNTVNGTPQLLPPPGFPEVSNSTAVQFARQVSPDYPVLTSLAVDSMPGASSLERTGVRQTQYSVPSIYGQTTALEVQLQQALWNSREHHDVTARSSHFDIGNGTSASLNTSTTAESLVSGWNYFMSLLSQADEDAIASFINSQTVENLEKQRRPKPLSDRRHRRPLPTSPAPATLDDHVEMIEVPRKVQKSTLAAPNVLSSPVCSDVALDTCLNDTMNTALEESMETSAHTDYLVHDVESQIEFDATQTPLELTLASVVDTLSTAIELSSDNDDLSDSPVFTARTNSMNTAIETSTEVVTAVAPVSDTEDESTRVKTIRSWSSVNTAREPSPKKILTYLRKRRDNRETYSNMLQRLGLMTPPTDSNANNQNTNMPATSTPPVPQENLTKATRQRLRGPRLPRETYTDMLQRLGLTSAATNSNTNQDTDYEPAKSSPSSAPSTMPRPPPLSPVSSVKRQHTVDDTSVVPVKTPRVALNARGRQASVAFDADDAIHNDANTELATPQYLASVDTAVDSSVVNRDAVETPRNTERSSYCRHCRRCCGCARRQRRPAATRPIKRRKDVDEWAQLRVQGLEGSSLPAPPPVTVRQQHRIQGPVLTAAQQVNVVTGRTFEAALYATGVVVLRGSFDGVATASSRTLTAAALGQPRVVYDDPTDKIVQLVAGDDHLVMRSVRGRIFTLGRAAEGQLGATMNPHRHRQQDPTPANMRRHVVVAESLTNPVTGRSRSIKRAVVFTDVAATNTATIGWSAQGKAYRCGTVGALMFPLLVRCPELDRQ